MKKLLFLFLLLAATVSCKNQLDVEIPLSEQSPGDKPVFYATVESCTNAATKVYADEDARVLWNKNDCISIFNLTTGNQQYRFTGRTGANAGSFNFVSGAPSATAVDHIYALYPYDEATSLSAEGVLSVSLPADQAYMENSFGIGANTMLSVSDGINLMFRNVCGYLAFKFYGDGVSVQRISLRGNNHEKLAGAATITMPLNGTPTVQMMEEAGEEVTITCQTPVALGADAEHYTEFWFVLPPVTLSQGLTVTVTDNQGGKYVKSNPNSIPVTRSYLRRISPLKVIPTYHEDWSIIGTFCDWNPEGEMIMTKVADGKWSIAVAFTEPVEFKIRKNAEWDINYGGTFAALDEPFTAVPGGDSILLDAGKYNILLDLSNPSLPTITVSVLTITLDEGTGNEDIGYGDWNF